MVAWPASLRCAVFGQRCPFRGFAQAAGRRRAAARRRPTMCGTVAAAAVMTMATGPNHRGRWSRHRLTGTVSSIRRAGAAMTRAAASAGF